MNQPEHYGFVGLNKKFLIWLIWDVDMRTNEHFLCGVVTGTKKHAKEVASKWEVFHGKTGNSGNFKVVLERQFANHLFGGRSLAMILNG